MSSARGMQRAPQNTWFAASKPPIIVMTFPDHVHNDHLRAALDDVQAWLRQVDAPFGFIVDMRRPLAISSVQRQMIAEVEKASSETDRRFNAAQAVVVTNALMRGIITAISWMSPPVYPLKIVPSIERAWLWVQPQFEEALAQYPDGPLWRRAAKAPPASALHP
jgi:hypothetical protein